MKTFIDNDGNEHPFLRENVNSIMSPPDTMEYAIRLAEVTFPAGIYSPNFEATTEQISEFLHNRGLSVEAAKYAADKGYKQYKEEKNENR